MASGVDYYSEVTNTYYRTPEARAQAEADTTGKTTVVSYDPLKTNENRVLPEISPGIPATGTEVYDVNTGLGYTLTPPAYAQVARDQGIKEFNAHIVPPMPSIERPKGPVKPAPITQLMPAMPSELQREADEQYKTYARQRNEEERRRQIMETAPGPEQIYEFYTPEILRPSPHIPPRSLQEWLFPVKTHAMQGMYNLEALKSIARGIKQIPAFIQVAGISAEKYTQKDIAEAFDRLTKPGEWGKPTAISMGMVGAGISMGTAIFKEPEKVFYENVGLALLGKIGGKFSAGKAVEAKPVETRLGTFDFSVSKPTNPQINPLISEMGKFVSPFEAIKKPLTAITAKTVGFSIKRANLIPEYFKPEQIDAIARAWKAGSSGKSVREIVRENKALSEKIDIENIPSSLKIEEIPVKSGKQALKALQLVKVEPIKQYTVKTRNMPKALTYNQMEIPNKYLMEQTQSPFSGSAYSSLFVKKKKPFVWEEYTAPVTRLGTATRTATIQAQLLKQIGAQKTATRTATKQAQSTIEKQATQIATRTAQALEQTTITATAQKQALRMQQKQISRMLPRMKPPFRMPEGQKRTYRFPMARLTQKSLFKSQKPGFNVFARVRGKPKIIGRNLAYGTAMAKGAKYLDITPAASFKLTPSGSIASRGYPPSSFNPFKFRPAKSRKLKGWLVEKTKFRMDIPKERGLIRGK